MSDISTIQQAAALKGGGALLGILGWERLLGAPPDSKMRMWMGRGGERCEFCSLHRVDFSLDYTCQGTGRGPRPNSKAPPLNPSLWPREGGYRPAACPVHLPSPPPSPPPCLPTATTSSLRHRDSVQGPEGPGWTPGPRADQRP